MDAYLSEKYGGVVMYLRMMGLTVRKESSIRKILGEKCLAGGEQETRK